MITKPLLTFLFFFLAWIGSRHVVTFMLFLGMANAYIMRTNMSVAIVAMVNQTALERDPTIPDDECEGFYTPIGNTTSHVSFSRSSSSSQDTNSMGVVKTFRGNRLIKNKVKFRSVVRLGVKTVMK